VALLLINLSRRASSTVKDKLWPYSLYTIRKDIKNKYCLPLILPTLIAFTRNSFCSIEIIGIAI
jgi:hypothetical protein